MSLPRRRRATVLLVDDDRDVAPLIRGALESNGYQVSHVTTGGEARAQVVQSPPDLVVLDLILPDVDGLVLCSSLKGIASMPIVVCSATRRQHDPVLALRLGADDFVHKPFDLDDLLARLEVVLRHSPASPAPAELRAGDLLVEPARRRALLGGQLLALTPTEFRLITVLAEHPDEVLSRDALSQEVWSTHDPSHARAVDVHVRRLRLKMARASVHAPAIVSVRGAGYKLAAQTEASSAA